MKGDEKCKNRWFEGRLGVPQGDQQHNHSIEHIYDFLFNFNRNYVSILYRFYNATLCYRSIG